MPFASKSLISGIYFAKNTHNVGKTFSDGTFEAFRSAS